MSNTIDRSYPGDLAAGTGLSFRTDLNADRTTCFGHTEGLETALELLAASYMGNGTIPGNTAELYVDNPTAGRVYCPVGYKAIVGGAPVETTAIIYQSYSAGVLNHVFLVVGTDGTLSLRVSTSATENANDLWIADVSDVGAIVNEPTGKVYAALAASKLAAALTALIQGTPTITVGEEAADTINVAVQLKDAAGTNLAAAHLVRVWLSDAAGGAVTGTAPSGTVVIGTDGVLIDSLTAKTHLLVASDAAGAFDLDIGEAGAATWYLNVEYQGKVYSSSAITFTA